MDENRGKLVSPPQGAQVSQGKLDQASQLIGEEISDTSKWVEIYRTRDDWEVKLIQATLGAQKIRCRPVQIKSERQTLLFVEPEHQVTAMELVSRVGVAITDNQMTTPQAETLKQRDMAAVQEPEQQAAPSDSAEVILAERESIGSVVYVHGHGYELRIGAEPYMTIPEDEWEEFTDFSAQRQEFFILLRHEYPELFQWLQQEKLLAEFIRLIEMTYQDGAPILTPTTDSEMSPFGNSVSNTSQFDSSYNGLATLSLSIAVISLLTLLIQAPWYATLGLSLVSIATAVIAKSQIDTSDSDVKGTPMAFSAIVLSCLTIVFAWWLSQQPPPAEPGRPPVKEIIEDR